MTTAPGVPLAYVTPRGMAWYVGGSGLNHGVPLYRLGTATLTQAQIVALIGRTKEDA